MIEIYEIIAISVAIGCGLALIIACVIIMILCEE